MPRRTTKRTSQSPKSDRLTPLDENVIPDILKEKRRKVGAEQNSISSESPANSNGKSTTAQKPEDYSSDSSSDGFEQPQVSSKLGVVNSMIKQDPVTIDFTSIENNIFSGVSRLSDSEDEDSDFEDVKPNQSSIMVEKNDPKDEVPIPVLEKNVGGIENKRKGSRRGKSVLDKNVGEMENKRIGNRRGKSVLEKNVGEKENKRKGGRRGKSLLNTKVSTDKPNEPSSSQVKGISISSTDVNKMDVSQLLALGEGPSTGSQIKEEDIVQDSDSDSENELTDWEDVEGMDNKPEKHSIPESGVEITLQMPEVYRKRRKKEFDMESHLRRRLNRVKRELQVLIHKVNLLCWIAHGRYVNAILNSEVLLGISLSLIPSQHCCPPKHTNLDYLEQIAKWFVKTVNVKDTVGETSSESLCESLQNQFQSRMANSVRDLVLMFICLLRALGIKTRLILSLQPVPLKPSKEELCTAAGKPRGRRPSKAVNDIKEEVELKPDLENSESLSGSGTLSVKEENEMQKDSQNSSKGKKKQQKKFFADVKARPSTSNKKAETSKSRTLKNSTNKEEVGLSDEKMDKLKRTLRQRKEITNKYKDASSGSDDEIERTNKSEKNVQNPTTTGIKSKRNSKSQPGSSPKENKTEDTSSSSNKKSQPKRSSKETVKSIENNDTPKVQSARGRKSVEGSESSKKQLIKSSSSPGENKSSAQQGKKRRSLKKDHDSDSDFEPASLTQKKSKNTKEQKTDTTDSESEFEPKKTPIRRKSSSGKPFDRRVLSSDSASSGDGKTKKKVRKGYDVWTEVFLEEEERWISVDVATAKLLCVEELHKKATQPVTYVLAFNNDLTLKDVTCRYCAQFTTITRKLRVDEGWWKRSLRPFHTPRTALDREEDEELNRLMLELPGLNRVARKLGIDCAPAMIGFDFHAGGTHPVFDGFIEQDEAEKRRKEKLEKRVYGNWRRLIKGLLIRERLKLRYSFGEEAGPSEPKLFSKNSKLLSTVVNAPKINRKSNANRGRKSNVIPLARDKKGKQKVASKRRKVESEEESESYDDDDDEDEDEDENFDSDKDWD
ncbi:hypothetical protein C0J52_03340 [Blattella germanica]|nr:hypothetical protein C0J52_03340 [Blattella germanica]